MADRLSLLLEQFSLSARVFYSGELCGTANFDASDGVGHLHLIRGGDISLIDHQGRNHPLAGPTLVFFGRPATHRLTAPDDSTTEVLCASVAFGNGGDSPMSHGLPSPLIVPLAAAPSLAAVVDLLFDEAFAERCGRQAALDRLAELLAIGVLRHVLDQRLVEAGPMAGLADPKLRKALQAIHAAPAARWTLEDMAREAGMSRSRFAAHFNEVVGTTPADYLASWRVSQAMEGLRRGRQVKQVALDVGYANASALARSFVGRIGQSPLQWLLKHRAHKRSAA